MQLTILETLDDAPDYTNKRCMIGLSGGINSAAVLAYLASIAEKKPDDIYLFYAHFEEHSPQTEEFVLACVEYAKKHFNNVYYTQTNNSVLDFFKKANMIPHPMISPCTRLLKIEPIAQFMIDNKIDVDLVGYVRSEKKRINNQQKRLSKTGKQDTKQYPIANYTDNDCFQLVEREIGWYPDIYKILWSDPKIIPFLEAEKENMIPEQWNIAYKYAKRGFGYRKVKRVFKHNNCLPCKNMHAWELMIVKCFYPEYYEKSIKLACEVESHWGRLDEQPGGDSAACTYCAFD